MQNLEFLVIWEAGMVVGGHWGRLWCVEVESWGQVGIFVGEELEAKYQKLVGIVAAKEMLKEGLSSQLQVSWVGDQKKHI